MAGDAEEARVRHLEHEAEQDLEEEESVPPALQSIEAVDEHSGKGVVADPEAGPLSGRDGT